ncbi:MAG TPA: pitrilysin family protein [Candidatus Acidoferrales bacterium]|nr:pitrilysin family protein [Candidatus Acidoferrales bacterium]
MRSQTTKIATTLLAFALGAVIITAAQNGPQTARPADSPSTGNPNGTGVVPPGVKLVPQRPAPAGPKAFHFPDAATKTLPNGLRVFVVHDASEPEVAVHLVVMTAGTSKDDPKAPGVAQMTANMLTQGTQSRSAQQIAQAIDFVGGNLNATAGFDSTDVTLSIVKKDLTTGLDLMQDVVLHPAFKADELDRQREQLLSNFEVEYSDPDYLATQVFGRVLYGNSPYGLPPEGTPDSVKRMDPDALIKFHDANYAPNQSLLAFAGDITPDEAFAAAEKYFGSWPKSAASDTTPPALAGPSGLHFWLIDKPDAVQTQIRVGRLGIRRADPDYTQLLVANRIFGGGYNSRLNTEVRIKKGLTYSAYSSFNPHRYAGSFAVGTYTRTPETVEATKLVMNLLSQMATGDVSPKEMDFARDYLAGVYPIQSETADQVAGRVLTVAEYGLPADYNSTYPDKIRAVTADQVKAMAVKYMTADNLDVVLAGNVSAFRDDLKKEFPSAKFDEIAAEQIDLLAPDLRAAKPAVAAATPASLAAGKQVLDAAVQAAGGDALKSVSGVAMTESEKLLNPSGDQQRDVNWSVAYPNRCRAEVQSNGMTIRQGSDGKSAWIEWQSQTHDATQMMGEFQRGIALFGGGWGLYQQALAGKIQAQAIGEEQIDGKNLPGVMLQTAFGNIKLYFDPQTHLLAVARYQSATSKGAVDSEQRWSDYRTVDGRQFAFSTVVYRDGQKYMESTVKDLKLNPALQDSLFAAPQQPQH